MVPGLEHVHQLLQGVVDGADQGKPFHDAVHQRGPAALHAGLHQDPQEVNQRQGDNDADAVGNKVGGGKLQPDRTQHAAERTARPHETLDEFNQPYDDSQRQGQRQNGDQPGKKCSR